MRTLIAAGLALIASAAAQAGARSVLPRPTTRPAQATAQPSVPASRSRAASVAETPDQVARRYHLAGEMLVGKGDKVVLDAGYGPLDPAGGATHRAGERWRLASVTKQVTAALAVKQSVDGRLLLDAPIGFRAADGAPFTATARQLLTHHSGLANPDASPPGVGGVPGFYLKPAPDLGYCASKPAVADAPFSYDNCDYILLAQPLNDPDGTPLDTRWPAGMAMAKPGEVGIAGFVHGKPEPRVQLASYGAAGGLMGTARALFDFDRSLVNGEFLPPPALAELWRAEGGGSYQALGQWVFPGRLKGCAAPKRIVQRDGEIYGVQARNFILPDDDIVVIVFTNRSSEDFAFDEVWQGKGFAYDLLSAAACA